MNIIMMTNTYKPITGGLERSVEVFSREMRAREHNVLIVAPEHEGAEEKEEGVVRVPAIQHFNGTDFSVQLPIPLILSNTLKKFNPDIVHAHHPFLIGDTALRVSAYFRVPLVFTYHTLYEKYTHYVPADSEAMKKFVIELSKGYANLCDYVFAPSKSLDVILRKRGVKSPIEINPTGIYEKEFASGDGKNFREKEGIPSDVFVIGYTGRVAPEKNMVFLSNVVSDFMKTREEAYFLCLGDGPSLEKVKSVFYEKGLKDRTCFPGVVRGRELYDGYASMDLFAFASKSETQGLVIAEAMASGTPVLAIDAPGVRDVVEDGQNGRLIREENREEFIKGFGWAKGLNKEERKKIEDNALRTAGRFSVGKSIERALAVYKKVIEKGYSRRETDKDLWQGAMRALKAEWRIASNIAISARKAAESKRGGTDEKP